MRGTSRRGLLHVGAAALLATPAVAQPRPARWPDRPVRLVVPYAAGGGNDLLARLYGQRLAEALGQPFVVDNRAGAGAVIGTEIVMRARPDGQTLVVHASGPVLWERGADRPAYDRQADLTPIAILGRFPGMFLVPAANPARDMAELVAWLRANPQRNTYGGGGPGFQLLGAYFGQVAGVGLEFVSYRSSGEAVTALMAGDVALVATDPGPAHAAIEGGRVRALAVSSPHRTAAYPTVPTMIEQGFPGFAVEYWIGLFGPAGLPEEIVQRLSTLVRETGKSPDMRQRLALHAVEPSDLDPEAFRQVVLTNDAVWRDVARRGGIPLER